MVDASGARPNSSPQEVRTAGATCTMTVFLGSAMAASTRSVSSRSRSAPVGQWVMHWPHAAQSTVEMGFLPRTPTEACVERLVRSQTPTPWTFSQTWTHRRHFTHFSLSRQSGKAGSHSSRARCSR